MQSQMLNDDLTFIISIFKKHSFTKIKWSDNVALLYVHIFGAGHPVITAI